MHKRSSKSYEFGPFRLDPDRRMLFRENQVVSLSPKVLQTLLVLVENSGRVVGKDELIKAVWPEAFVEEGNLTQNISTLRKGARRETGLPVYRCRHDGNGDRDGGALAQEV